MEEDEVISAVGGRESGRRAIEHREREREHCSQFRLWLPCTILSDSVLVVLVVITAIITTTVGQGERESENCWKKGTRERARKRERCYGIPGHGFL